MTVYQSMHRLFQHSYINGTFSPLAPMGLERLFFHSNVLPSGKVFVLGGTGFVGSQVVRSLLLGGHEVVVFHRGQTHADLPPAVRTLHGDRHDLPAFAGEVAGFRPDVVIDGMAQGCKIIWH